MYSKKNQIASIKELRHPQIKNRFFLDITEEDEVLFRLQLLQLYAFGMESQRINQLPGINHQLFDPSFYQTFKKTHGVKGYHNISRIARYKQPRQLLRQLPLQELKRVSQLEFGEEFGENATNILRYFLTYRNKALLSHDIKDLEQFLSKFSKNYIKLKMKTTENNGEKEDKEIRDKKEEELTFIEDVLLLLESHDSLYSEQSLIINAFLRHAKNNLGFLNNPQFENSLDATIWGLRYSLRQLGFETLLETLTELHKDEVKIDITQVVRFVEVYKETPVIPSIGVHLV